jgi:hypothetical protein
MVDDVLSDGVILHRIQGRRSIYEELVAGD